MNERWPHTDWTAEDVAHEQMLLDEVFPAADERTTRSGVPHARWDVGEAASRAPESRDDSAAGNHGPARWSDPSTSYAAGASVSPEGIAASEAWVLRVVSEFQPITDDALCQIAEQRHVTFSPSRIRTARSELVRRGRIVLADRDGTTSTGRRAQRWTTTTTLEGIAS